MLSGLLSESKGVGKVGGIMARELELDSGWYSKRISGGVGAFSGGNVGDGPLDDGGASVSRFLPCLVSRNPSFFSGGKAMSQLESGS